MKIGSTTRTQQAEPVSRVAWSARLLVVAAVALMALPAPVISIPVAHAAAATVTTCSGDQTVSGSLPNLVFAASSGDTINFSVDCPSASPIQLGVSLTISGKTLTVDGSGHSVAVSGQTARQIFQVQIGSTLTVKNLTLQNGHVDAAAGSGGAINNAGTLSVDRTTFLNNSSGANGGAIASTGTLTVTNSTFTGNSAAAHGGAIDANNEPGLPASVITSDTFNGNTADFGGAMAFGTNNPVNIVNSTFSGNIGTTEGGAIGTYAAANLSLSTVANNTSPAASLGFGDTGSRSFAIRASILDNAKNCGAGGTFNNNGSNLWWQDSTDDCNFGLAARIDPGLGGLADNGGPTQTLALNSASPAVDGVPACTAVGGSTVATDQRGVPRPQGSACDIGAYELDTSAPRSTISFPTSGGASNASDWLNECNASPWNVTYSICGYASDSNPVSPGIAAVALRIKAITGSHAGNYWDGATCSWGGSEFWNLAVLAGGTGASGGFTSSGGGFTSSGGGFSSSGGGFTSAGGGFTSAGGLCDIASGGFSSSGGGFSSSGGGFSSAGGGFSSSGGGGVAIPWYYPTSLPADGTYFITVQAQDDAGNREGDSCSTSGCQATTTVDTRPPVTSVTFPASVSDFNATKWQSGCNGSPWNVTYSVCGYATDSNAYGSDVASVGLLIQATSGSNTGQYWNGATCSWQLAQFWNLAVLAGGSGASGGFSSSGGGFTSSGGGFTSAGGGFSSAGGGYVPTTPVGGVCSIINGGFSSSGGGFSSSGGGFSSAGGAPATGSGVARPWYYPLSLPTDGTYSITTQSVDNAGNREGDTCSTAGCQSTTQVDTTRPTASLLINGQRQSGAQNIDASSIVHITFSEPMNQTSLSAIQITPAPGPFTATCTDGGFCQNIDLMGAQLKAATIYTVTLPAGTAGCSGCLKDLASNGLDSGGGSTAPKTFAFTTSAGVPSSTTDSDSDGIPDVWDGSATPLTLNGQAIDTRAWGFKPNHKDLCVVEEYMGNSPYDQHILQAANQDVVHAFANSPVTNADGTTGVHLVVFESNVALSSTTLWSSTAGYSAGLPTTYTGPFFGGQFLFSDSFGFTNPNGSYDWTAADAIRNQYFVPAGLAPFCHNGIITHTFGGTSPTTPSLSTGSSRGLGSGDFVIALGTEPDGVGTEIQQAGTLMHELGHNLGLHHGGSVDPESTVPLPPDIDTNYKPNYLSVMNYNFQLRGVPGGSATLGLDYSLGALNSLDKNHLDDSIGLGAAASGFGTRYWCGTASKVVFPASGLINWGCLSTGPLIGSTHAANIDNDPGQIVTLLNDYNDWAHLRFRGDGTIGLGATGALPATTTIDTAVDASGNGANSVANVDTNVASFSFAGFFAPINPDATGKIVNTGKAGRTYPVKFQLKDASGSYISSLSAVRSVTFSKSTVCAGGTTDPIESSTTSNSGLTYDSSAHQFQYNWATPSTVGCYMLKVNLMDGTTKQGLFSLY